jgi:hypothetical protein
MSLVYIGMSGREEVAALQSFSTHVSASQANKMAVGVIGNDSKCEVCTVVRFLQAGVRARFITG